MAHVFVSYVHENEKIVARLCSELGKAGVEVWQDRGSIIPGRRWRHEIRKAIKGGTLFIACFSAEYSGRDTTFMNEELKVAIGELRKRPADRSWFIPVIISECEMPALEIGSGETLKDIQYVSLVNDWRAGIAGILEAIGGAQVNSGPIHNGLGVSEWGLILRRFFRRWFLPVSLMLSVMLTLNVWLLSQVINAVKQDQGWTFFVPASQLWFNSGIRVEAGDKLHFRISGGANVAAHRLMLHSFSDRKPTSPWIFHPLDTRGSNSSLEPGKADEGFVIDDQSAFGDLLMVVFPDDNRFTPGVDNSRPRLENASFVYKFNRDKDWASREEVSIPHAGLAYFVVNDWVLKDGDEPWFERDGESLSEKTLDSYRLLASLLREGFSPDADSSEGTLGDPWEELRSAPKSDVRLAELLFKYYGLPPRSMEEYRRDELQEWNSLLERSYWDVWYNDNIGGYLVEVSKGASAGGIGGLVLKLALDEEH